VESPTGLYADGPVLAKGCPRPDATLAHGLHGSVPRDRRCTAGITGLQISAPIEIFPARIVTFGPLNFQLVSARTVLRWPKGVPVQMRPWHTVYMAWYRQIGTARLELQVFRFLHQLNFSALGFRRFGRGVPNWSLTTRSCAGQRVSPSRCDPGTRFRYFGVV
jgi:hypothetical protein